MEVQSSEGPQVRSEQGKVTEIKDVQARIGSSPAEENGKTEEIPQKNVFMVLEDDSLKGGSRFRSS